MRGRWGLVPADCSGPASEAKGLMTVGADTIDFYEAHGTLASASSSDAEHLRGTFAMTGEGANWNRDEALVLTDGGLTLVRREFGKDAIPEPLTYHRCH
jgi:hypothetical protein